MGIAIYFSSTLRQKAICAVLAAGAIALQSGISSSAFHIPFLGMMAMLIAPTIRLPRQAARVTALVASATYFTYLLHMLVLRIVQQKLGVDHTALLVILSFVAGLAGAWAWGHLLLAARSAWAGRLKPASLR